MIISHRKKYVFIHFLKTGGTAISQHFRKHKEFCVDTIGHWGPTVNIQIWNKFKHIMNGTLPQHCEPITVKAYFDLMGWNWDEYFKFAFIRNPWDRIVSSYEWRRSVADTPEYNFYESPYLKYLAKQADVGFDKHAIDFFVKPWHMQHDKMLIENKPAFNYVGRFENFKEDMSNIIKTIIPGASEELKTIAKANHSKRRKDYRSYYTSELKAELESIDYFKKENKILRYEF
tara:strand:+ start:301 stop:993 length:693 start_codon:yes stop_codon:yes gene_type:complete